MTLHASRSRGCIPLRINDEATTRVINAMREPCPFQTKRRTQPACLNGEAPDCAPHASHAKHLKFFTRIRATAIQVAMHQLAVEQRRYIKQAAIKAQDVFDVRVIVMGAAVCQLLRFSESSVLPFDARSRARNTWCFP
ncbi:MAG: hypothetical protein PW845_17510 [Pseudomonas sp.]|nr:hypothetical protein [Pseudomonas sp.]